MVDFEDFSAAHPDDLEEAADDGEEASTADSLSELCTPPIDGDPKVTLANDKKLQLVAEQLASALKQASALEKKPVECQRVVEQPKDIEVMVEQPKDTQGDRASVIGEQLKEAFEKAKKSNPLVEKDGNPKALPLHVPSLTQIYMIKVVAWFDGMLAVYIYIKIWLYKV